MDGDADLQPIPMGAHVHANGVTFCVWAPQSRAASVVVDDREIPMHLGSDGFFCVDVPDAAVGTRYRFRLDDGEPMPDPASRFQPDGPHGASEVIDLSTFGWSDSAWRGIEPAGQVIYEMHIGTFTRAGTWRAAIDRLASLAELGITVVEVMPLAEFPGRFGWGYDGVQPYAPYHAYGRPEDVCAFINAAHALGIGVIVDVVYNHLGPDGNYLPRYTPDWFGAHHSEWGDGPNFDGARNAPVREFFAGNAAYWIESYHADGLRIDATQQLFDRSPQHVLELVVERAEAAAKGRRIYIVAENQTQRRRIVTPRAQGGRGCTAVWNDDFHHSLRVALTGRNDAYFSDYTGCAQEILSCLKRGFLYQGQRSAWVDKKVGTSASGVPPHAFVHFLENHDQVANSLCGARLVSLASPAALRAATAVLLLGPQTPMIFQGQETGARQPFLFFADHKPKLARAVREGRAKFLSQFEAIAPLADCLDDPSDPRTFERCKLEHDTADETMLNLFRDLLRMRREDPTIAGATDIDGAVLSSDAFVLRYFGDGGDDRLLLVNLGADFERATIAEPLLAPPDNRQWRLRWSSEDPRYGGSGAYPYDPAAPIHLAARSASLLVPEAAAPEQPDGSP